jgi:recombination protein RecT
MSSALVTVKGAAAELATQLEKARPRLEMILPRDMSADRVIGVANNLFQRDPYLRECEPTSIVRAVVQCAELGLDPSPKLGQAYFIPRSVKVKGLENGRPVEKWVKRCEMQIGYKGGLAKAYQSDRILSIDVEMVHEHDRFEIHRGTHPDVLHEYGLAADRGVIVGGYCAARLGPADAVPPVWKVAHMTIAEINGIRDNADSYRKWKNATANGKKWHPPPWETDYEEMCKKTILVRACKTLPVGDAFRAALEADADELRTQRKAAAESERGGSAKAADLREKLGAPAQTDDVVDADFDEVDPDGPESP